MFPCPKCRHRKTAVYRSTRINGALMRYRRCPACQHRFKVWVNEEIDPRPITPQTRHD